MIIPFIYCQRLVDIILTLTSLPKFGLSPSLTDCPSYARLSSVPMESDRPRFESWPSAFIKLFKFHLCFTQLWNEENKPCVSVWCDSYGIWGPVLWAASLLYFFDFLKKYFIDYAITIVPIFSPFPPPPLGTPHSLTQSPHHCSCPCVMRTSS